MQSIINHAVGIGFVYGWLVGIGMYCFSKIRKLGQSKRYKERRDESIK